MIKKEFTYTKVVEKKVTKTVSVFEPGTLLKCTSAYQEFKVGEIILVHGSLLNNGRFSSDRDIVYDVTWFYVDRKFKSVAPRTVWIKEDSFIECSFDDLKKYIKDNTL